MSWDATHVIVMPCQMHTMMFCKDETAFEHQNFEN